MKQLLRKLFAASPRTPASAPAPLRRRGGGVMLLEQRFMFDGAAVGQVVDQLLDADDAPDAPAQVPLQEPLFRVDVPAAALAQQQVRDYLARVSADEFNRPFLGQGETPDAQWMQAAQALRDDILAGRYGVDVQLLSHDTLRGAWGAFAAQGPDGGPVIYLNADWVRHGAASEDIARVLVEELGHAIDARLNPAGDTAGDEGELFSTQVFATGEVSETYRAMLRLQDDHRTIEVNGQQVQVEFASLNFTNAYAVYTGAVGSNTFLADKEQNRHHFNPTLLGVANISDGTGGQSFSGNDISVELTIGATTYYGWISRPIKDQGIVRGFYFWKDSSFTSLSAAQTDGNQDRDGTAADNSGFILVVDQAWFNSIGYESGSSYKFVGSSSDRVDSALNSVMPTNGAPTPANDTQTIAEDATATGNVLTNDSDPNNDTLSVTQFVINGTTYGASALGVAQTISGVGSFTLNANGSYTFTPDANYTGSVPAVTYTVSDGQGATATAVLSITVTPANDAPTGGNDSVTTSENTTVILGLNDFGTFTDADGDRLAKIQITTLETNGSLEYYNGTSWVAVTLNQEFTSADISGGNLRFVPDTGENGSPYTTVGFKVSDGTAYSASAYTLTVNVTAVNTAPVANADNADLSAYAVESGAAEAGSHQTGNVLTNDTDADGAMTAGTTHKVTDATSAALTTSVSVTSGTTSTSSPAIVTGLYGTLKIGANGTYIYEVDNSNAQVQALRTTANTLTETFTYTMADSGGLTAASTLTVVIKGSNDAPAAVDDRDTVQETSTATGASPVYYGITTGDVLINDTDVDAGDTESVGKVSIFADGISPAASGTTITLSSSASPSLNNNYVYYLNGATKVFLKNASNNEVKVASYSGSTVTLDSVVVTSIPTGTTLYFVSNVNSGTPQDSATYSSSSSRSASDRVSTGTMTASLVAGMEVIGTGIPTGTYIGTVDTANSRITLVDGSSNAVTVLLSSTQSLEFRRDAGQVLTGRYGQLTLDSNGSYTYKLTSTALNSGQTYTEEFTYTVTDTAGASDTGVLYIRIDGSTGVTTDDESATTAEDTTLTVADGGAGDLLVGDSGVTTIDTFSWGGQSASAGGTISLSGIGDLTVNANGSYTFTPASNYTGPVPVATYNATDGQATPAATGSATLSITITSTNDAPTASNDAVTTPEDTAILLRATDFGVFSDAEGATLAAVRISTLETNGALQKYDGTNWVDVALNDTFTAADLAAGKLRFVPDADENASPYTTVGFEVSDGTNWSASAYTLTVNVTPVNDAPVNTVPGSQSLYDYQTLAIGDLVAGSPYDLAVADVDGSTDISSVTVSVGYGTLATSNAGGGTLSGSGTGTVTLSGNATQLNAMLAALVYTPNTGYSGTDALKIYTVDAAGASDTDFVAITVNPDNRALTVTGTIVNEASPYVMFTVDGEKGQRVSLAAGETGSGAAHATMGTDFLPNLQYFNGTSWVDYSGGYVTIPDTVANTNGLLLVRAAVLQDSTHETTTSTYETLKLTATNAAGTAASGNSQIRDDKAGSIYLASNNTSTANTNGDSGYPAYLDDDRPISINNIAVNEASPKGVFTITGTSGQVVSFALTAGSALLENGNGTVATDGSEDAGTALEIWNGTSWQAYTAGADYTLTSSTTYVRTAINPDTGYEGQHTFFLGVTRKAAGDTAYGAGNIFDDGTGSYWIGDNTAAATSSELTTASITLDDDRSISVDSPTVNEASDDVVFTVTGNSGQTATLALVNESSGGTVTGKANPASQTLKVWDGYAWGDYDANNPPAFDANGKIFVRVSITAEQDTPYEGSETFKLNATLSGTSTAVAGTATIVDDGTGVKYPGTFTSGSPTTSSTGLEDDRILAVSSPTVNEGSPYVIFEVSGIVGDTASLALSNASGASSGQADLRTGGTLPTLQYYGAGGWTDYNAASPPTIPAGGVLRVRVAISAEQESGLDGPETFKLVATNASNQASTGGTATIVDDGSGSYFAADNTSGTSSVPSGVTLDDDRTLAVDSMTVNEASDYVVFTVTGDSGNTVQLSLVNESAGGTVSGKANIASQTLKVWSGSAWVDYNASSLPTFNGSGQVFVRVAITSEQDTPYEGAETFKLQATQSNRATAVSGTATIVDDGTGVRYTGDLNGGGTAPVTSTTSLDDDRTLAVSSPTVNEGSPYVIFEVSGVAGQTAALSLSNASGGGNADLRTSGQLPTLQYYANGQWNDYNPSSPPTIPAGGKLLVRVPIDAEQEKAKDGPETFKLVATNSNGQASTGGTATIVDDGTGSYFATDNTNGTSSVPSGVTLDDDRPKAILPPPPPPPPGRADAPPPPPPEAPPARPVPAFNSALPPASRAPMAAEPPAPMGDSLTSASGFRVVVNSVAPPGLTVYRGITDQFVEKGAGTKVSLPYDAFIHSKEDAVIKLESKLADDRPLPPWVRFDPANGTFDVTPPPGFTGRLDVKVAARDDEGREAVAIFRLFVGEQAQPATPPGPQSRDSFSDKLKVASKRPVTLIRISDAQPLEQPALKPRAAPAVRAG